MPALDSPCDGCGQCCRNQPFPPYLWIIGDEPPEPHYTQLREAILSPHDHPDHRNQDQPCLWLTPEGRCRHYDLRPEICQDFEPGSDDCNFNRQLIDLTPINPREAD